MIRLRKDWRGRPGARVKIAECTTVADAVQVVKTLREVGIEAKWPSRKPFIVSCSSDRALEAVAYLEGRQLEAAA